jgi:2-C-methyl-D-erythritol 4-phosphate cytidylyltransferase/2-C-methyl-D-erythritol 2,4-cyclodiphosphate synthase
VLIHDAARPDLPESVIAALVEALARHEAAIPVLPVVDSLVRGGDGMMLEPARREGLYRSADAPGVPLPGDPSAHRAWQGEAEAGDDAQVAVAAGHAVALVQGEERLRQVTFASDLQRATFRRTR